MNSSRMVILASACFLVACSDSAPDAADASALVDAASAAADARISHDAGTRENAAPTDASVSADAAPGDASEPQACLENRECTLNSTACCAACQPTLRDVVGVRIGSPAAESPCGLVNCAPCPQPAWSDIPTALRAACVLQRCTAVDLRVQDVTACTRDADCEARPATRCPSCGPDVTSWVAMKKGAVDSTLPESDGSGGGACPPCVPTPPRVRCAEDMHCALLRPEREAGTVSETCFSPLQNRSAATAFGSTGCDCVNDGDSACDGGVPLVCAAARWAVTSTCAP